MSETQNFHVIVNSVHRMQRSKNGNPRFQFLTNKGTFNTQADAQCGYTVTNDFREYAEYSIPAVLHCNNRGSVIGWTLTD